MKQYDGKINFGYEKIQQDVLEFFPYEFKGEKILLKTETEEFNCLCPWSSLPDFATLKIEYIPNERCIELKTFKMYIVSYREVGIFHEHAVNKIFNDIAGLIIPQYLKVILEYKNRGGFLTTAEKEKYFI